MNITPAISSQVFGRGSLGEKQVWMTREFGFSALEIYGVPPHFDCGNLDQVHEVAAALRKHEVTPAALHSSYKMTMEGETKAKSVSLSFGNPKKRLYSLDIIYQAVEAAEIIGAKTVIVHFGVFGDKVKGDVLSNIISALILIEEYISGKDVRIAFENVATPVSMSGYISYTLTKYDFKSMGVCLDLGHANINEDSALAVENCGDKLFHIHASDNTGVNDSHLLPTEGKVDWTRVMNALSKANYEGYFVFETRSRMQPDELLPKCLEIYDKLLGMVM